MLHLLLAVGVALTAGATTDVPLELVVLADSGWGPETVYPHIERAQRIFAACDIHFGPVALRTIAAPEFVRQAPADQELVDAHPELRKPAIFFFAGAGSEAYGEDFSPTAPRRVLEYTAWIGSHVNSAEYVRARSPLYDTVAHEIAHLLCNCGHVEPGIPNLLSGQVEFVNDQVTPAQCAQFRSSPLARPRPTPES